MIQLRGLQHANGVVGLIVGLIVGLKHEGSLMTEMVGGRESVGNASPHTLGQAIANRSTSPEATARSRSECASGNSASPDHLVDQMGATGFDQLDDRT